MKRALTPLLPAALLAGVLLLPLLPFQDPHAVALDARLLPPGSEGRLLGSDELGRDLLSRIVHGTRLSLVVALVGVSVAAAGGTALGMCAAYFGRAVDSVLMRAVDVLLAFPYLLLALAIVAVLGPSLVNATIAIAIVNIPFFARTMRGATLAVMVEEYVGAARALGASNLRVLWYHLLPGVRGPFVVATATSSGWMLLETAGLSFLGLGAQPPTADLGGLVGQGRHLLVTAPHVALLPAATLTALVLGLNLLGDRFAESDVSRRRAEAPPQADGDPAESISAGMETLPSDPLSALTVSGLRVSAAETPLLDNVHLQVPKGHITGLIGESGSGKSLLTSSILGLLPAGTTLDAGQIALGATPLSELPHAQRRALLGKRIGFVPQNPHGSLHPLMSIGAQIVDAIRVHRRISRAHALSLAKTLLEEVRISDPEARLRSRPHELSGGMKQRIALALALCNDPELLVLDEPTTALDVTTQASLLELLRERRDARGLSLLFVTHDLGVVAELCDDVYVLDAGRIVERAPVADLFTNPKHPRTRALVAALAPKIHRSEDRSAQGTPGND